MIPAQTLSALHNLHSMMNHLLEQRSDSQLQSRPRPDIPALGWLFGRAIYLETYLIDEKLRGDDDLSGRVRHLFGHDVIPTPELEAQLPPREHLLNWAYDLQDKHLTLLANPGQLPSHPWLDNGWLPDYLLQCHGRAYEDMVACLSAHAIADAAAGYSPQRALHSAPLSEQITELSQGHYRIGARDGVVFDNELPTQVVELSSFRIAELPVSNGEYLSFMQDQGYQNDALWDDAGIRWRNEQGVNAPWHWRRNDQDDWYGIGLNGPFDLLTEEPVMGLSRHEASAYAHWVAQQPAFAGAVLQHEYQWEVASRTKSIKGLGRVREWCGNDFTAYDQYERPKDPELATPFAPGQVSLRGASLHTQPQLRRASMRYWAKPEARHLFAGIRLVFPPMQTD